MAKNNSWNFDTTYASGDILYASDTSTLSKLNIGSSGQALAVSSGLPAWSNTNVVAYNTLDTSYFDDMINYISFAGNGGLMNSNNGWNSAGSVVLAATSTATNPAISQLNTVQSSSSELIAGTSNFSGSGSVASGTILFGNAQYTLNFIGKIPTLSNGTNRFRLRLGYLNISVTNAGNRSGCWFEYIDNVNSGNWQVVTSNNGTATTNNTTNAADTNFHKFTIIVNTAGTSVSFYIDDVQVTGSPISTNIPTSAGREVGIIFQLNQTVGSGNVTYNIDWMSHRIQLQSRS